ncbi:TIGR04282 family arsenosugar biosynthesis glycosyltransferase [Psychroflexus sediminis]|uniref:DUF2064 domain-containing protein n=1 Tax=Psychroflexus sediminis TaxID=470826 RepID=A0A1G7ULP0_9FLAO|nr:DUF2064 domain-containing protein [Psychroflexus sediminis]SDG48525.1 hypothetical protein SAMN04488027_102157 [Psychroflexus sediminis]
MKTSVALLIFSRSVEAECSFKGFAGNQLFFQSQENRLKKLCSKTGLDVFNHDEHQQQGNTFGERFCNALSSVFSRGYDKVIVIGNDCPQLKYKHLQSGIDALHSGKACLGKSFDGGFYLLAIQKKHFNHSDFLNLSWNTSDVSSEVIQLLSTKAEVSFTPTLKDIDKQSDFSGLLNFSKQLYTDVILILKTMHKSYDFGFQSPSLYVKNIISGSFLNKAPPLLSRA